LTGRAWRDDFRSRTRRRGQHAVVPYQVESRRRHERRELGHELERFEQHVSRTVPPWMFQTVEHAAVGEQRQSLRGHRRPRTIAAKPLEALAIAGGHADIRMDVDTRYAGTPGAAWDHESLDVDSISDGLRIFFVVWHF
jgi:hypothetical protein